MCGHCGKTVAKTHTIRTTEFQSVANALLHFSTVRTRNPSILAPGANVVLAGQQEIGLHYVIEACADMIDGLFYDLEDELEIQWAEEHLPKVREARNQRVLLNVAN